MTDLNIALFESEIRAEDGHIIQNRAEDGHIVQTRQRADVSLAIGAVPRPILRPTSVFSNVVRMTGSRVAFSAEIHVQLLMSDKTFGESMAVSAMDEEFTSHANRNMDWGSSPSEQTTTVAEAMHVPRIRYTSPRAYLFKKGLDAEEGCRRRQGVLEKRRKERRSSLVSKFRLKASSALVCQVNDTSEEEEAQNEESKEMAENNAREVSEEVLEDIAIVESGEVAEEVAEEVSQDIAELLSGEVAGEVSKDIAELTSGEVSEEVLEEIATVISEEVSRESEIAGPFPGEVAGKVVDDIAGAIAGEVIEDRVETIAEAKRIEETLTRAKKGLKVKLRRSPRIARAYPRRSPRLAAKKNKI